MVKGSVTSDDLIRIEMGDILKIEKRDSAVFIDTGSPHHVEFVDQLSSVDVKSKAAIRYGAPYFETGSNKFLLKSK